MTVTEPGGECGAEADAAVTAVPGAVLSVYTADCAPVVLRAPGAVGVAHAGWRGIVGGVVQAAAEALRELSDGPIVAEVGPCIRGRCYEFGRDDLAAAIEVLGPTVSSQTAWGTPAFDVTEALGIVLARAGVHEVNDTGVCTACSSLHPSHRARGDKARMAAVAWLDDGRAVGVGDPPDGSGGVGN